MKAEMTMLKLLAKSNSYRNKLSDTLDFLSDIFKDYKDKSKYVAFSMGKDSVVLLDLVKKFDKNIYTYFYYVDYTRDLYNFDELWDYWAKNCNLHTFNKSFLYKDRISLHGYKNKALKRILYPDKDMSFLGLRREENRHRRILINKYGRLHKRKDKTFLVMPIAYWTWSEVGAYIISKDLPYLTPYKTSFQNRTAAKIAGSANIEKQLTELKMYDLESHNKIKNQI